MSEPKGSHLLLEEQIGVDVGTVLMRSGWRFPRDIGRGACIFSGPLRLIGRQLRKHSPSSKHQVNRRGVSNMFTTGLLAWFRTTWAGLPSRSGHASGKRMRGGRAAGAVDEQQEQCEPADLFEQVSMQRSSEHMASMMYLAPIRAILESRLRCRRIHSSGGDRGCRRSWDWEEGRREPLLQRLRTWRRPGNSSKDPVKTTTKMGQQDFLQELHERSQTCASK